MKGRKFWMAAPSPSWKFSPWWLKEVPAPPLSTFCQALTTGWHIKKLCIVLTSHHSPAIGWQPEGCFMNHYHKSPHLFVPLPLLHVCRNFKGFAMSPSPNIESRHSQAIPWILLTMFDLSKLFRSQMLFYLSKKSWRTKVSMAQQFLGIFSYIWTYSQEWTIHTFFLHHAGIRSSWNSQAMHVWHVCMATHVPHMHTLEGTLDQADLYFSKKKKGGPIPTKLNPLCTYFNLTV